MLAEPLFDRFLLLGRNHSLPLHIPSAFIVFGEDVSSGVQYQNQSWPATAFAVVRRINYMAVLH